MHTTEAIMSRRSVRKFDPDKPVTKEQIYAMLDAAMHAPSARNSRPWDFVVITKREDIRRMGSFMGGPQFETATAVVVVVAVPERQVDFCEGNHLNDCGAASVTLILQAWEMGIGSCWCGLYPVESRMEGAREMLGIPENVIPFCAIPMGIPAEKPACKGFYDEKLVHFDRW